MCTPVRCLLVTNTHLWWIVHACTPPSLSPTHPASDEIGYEYANGFSDQWGSDGDTDLKEESQIYKVWDWGPLNWSWTPFGELSGLISSISDKCTAWMETCGGEFKPMLKWNQAAWCQSGSAEFGLSAFSIWYVNSPRNGTVPEVEGDSDAAIMPL